MVNFVTLFRMKRMRGGGSYDRMINFVTLFRMKGMRGLGKLNESDEEKGEVM